MSNLSNVIPASVEFFFYLNEINSSRRSCDIPARVSPCLYLLARGFVQNSMNARHFEKPHRLGSFWLC